MKQSVRFLCSLFCILILVFSLFGCSKDPSVDSLAYRLLNLFPSLPPCSQYVKNSEPYTAGYLSAEDFSYLYVGTKERLPEWDLVEEFRIILSDATIPFELHILKTASATDTDEIAKLLQRRAELLKLHNKTEGNYLSYEPYIYTDGRYAVLAATEDNEAVRRLLKKLL